MPSRRPELPIKKKTALGGQIELPTPGPDAVDAGLFGVCADGSYRPNENEVRAIVQDQFEGLLRLALEIEATERVAMTGLNPSDGRLPKSELRKQQNRRRGAEQVKQTRLRLLGHSQAYEDAFGNAARGELLALVFELVNNQPDATPPPPFQQELF